MYDTLLFNVQKAFELSMCSQPFKVQRQFVQDVLWPKVIEEDVVGNVINLIGKLDNMPTRICWFTHTHVH